jgi:hypothetical protein
MLPFMWASQDKCFQSATAVIVNGMTVFTVTGGPIKILDLISVCVTVNDTTATTIQWQSVPTVGTATTFSGASGSLAAAGTGAGALVRLAPTALSTALVIIAASAGGVALGTNVANFIVVKEGTIKLVVGVGSTTGTWYHAIRYQPLTPSAIILG